MGTTVLNGISGPLVSLGSHDPVFSLDHRVLDDLPADGTPKTFGAVFAGMRDCYLVPVTANELHQTLLRMERDGVIGRDNTQTVHTSWYRI